MLHSAVQCQSFARRTSSWQTKPHVLAVRRDGQGLGLCSIGTVRLSCRLVVSCSSKKGICSFRNLNLQFVVVEKLCGFFIFLFNLFLRASFLQKKRCGAQGSPGQIMWDIEGVARFRSVVSRHRDILPKIIIRKNNCTYLYSMVAAAFVTIQR